MSRDRRRQAGQALGIVLMFGMLLLAGGAVVFTIGRAHAAKASAQTGADLTAVGTARSMGPRLTAAASLSGSDRERFRREIRDHAARAARAQGVRLVAFSWPEGRAWPPTQVQVTVAATGPMATEIRASARAVIRPGAGMLPEFAKGTRGEYRGPLVHRDGKPMLSLIHI